MHRKIICSQLPIPYYLSELLLFLCGLYKMSLEINPGASKSLTKTIVLWL